MAPTALTTPLPYVPLGKAKFYWVATIADPAAPTRTELDAGTDLSPAVTAVAGWSVSTTMASLPLLGTRFESQVAAQITPAASSITLASSSTDGNPVAGVLAQDDPGFIVRMLTGDNATGQMDVFPVYVASVSKPVTLTSPVTIQIDFAITNQPQSDLAIPQT